MRMHCIKLLMAGSCLSLLAGCASFPGQANASYEVDSYKVAAIERAAANSGVRVYWMHYPVKKVEYKPAS